MQCLQLTAHKISMLQSDRSVRHITDAWCALRRGIPAYVPLNMEPSRTTTTAAKRSRLAMQPVSHGQPTSNTAQPSVHNDPIHDTELDGVPARNSPYCRRIESSTSLCLCRCSEYYRKRDLQHQFREQRRSKGPQDTAIFMLLMSAVCRPCAANPNGG